MDWQAFLTHSFYMQLIGFIVSLILCAVFSFIETTITAMRLFKLKELASATAHYQKLLKTLEESPHQVLITILIANCLANVTAAALSTTIMENMFAQLNLSTGLGFSLGIGIATASILVFGEVIPKNIAKLHGEKLFHSILWITNVTYYILYPFVQILIRFSNFFIGYVGTTTTDYVTSEKEIQFLIDYIDEKGLMEKEKTEMLKSVFALGKKPVYEIMVPVTDVIMVDLHTSVEEVLTVFSKHQFSRLPVYDKSKDNIVGMVHVKDVSLDHAHKPKHALSELIRPILFVPESMKVNQLLSEFKEKRMHMAIVLNEYGSITGLVTLEDTLEEIVGDISDEYETPPEKIIALEKGGWLADATLDLESLKNTLGVPFKAEDAVTLGGFLTEKLQRLPKKGERLLYNGFYFQIQKASEKRVLQVLIFKDTASS